MESNQTEVSQAKPVGIAGVLRGQSIDGEAPKSEATDQGETQEAGAAGETTEGDKTAEGEGQTAAEAQAKPGDAKEEAGKEASPEVRGVLKGIQAERQKRQAAERERDELRAQIAQLTGQTVTEEITEQPQRPDPVTERRILTISENNARRAHSDFEEKFKTFAAEAEKNPALYDVVMGSDDPGEAAYQAGKTLQLQQKYGTDPEAMVSKVKEETETQMRDRIRKEVEAEMKEKISTKNNEPKNILAGRSAGKVEQETVPALTFSQLLAKRKG
jgi:hypothetical protein